jgi:hypothetical protein
MNRKYDSLIRDKIENIPTNSTYNNGSFNSILPKMKDKAVIINKLDANAISKMQNEIDDETTRAVIFLKS